jgi:hypothetical protein
MPLPDFISKKWKVIEADKSALCQQDQTVSFSQLVGLEGEVKISCNENPVYGEAKYNKATNRIEVGGYEIRLLIECKLKDSSSIAGSWTAEDQGPWPGDG